MTDSGEKRRIAKFVSALNSTKKWLDENFNDDRISDETRELIKTLYAYLRHCRRQIATGASKADALDRRRRKIEEAVFAIWKISHLEK